LTFDQLVKDTEFIGLMRAILEKLERFHKWPVDIEFTVEISQGYPHTEFTVHLLQCRPQISHKERQIVDIPDTIAPTDLILQTTELVPHGAVTDIRYIVYVPPDRYHHAPSYELKLEIARVIGRLNLKLANTDFMLIGPGRWGSSDVDLGVKVTYADIHNTRVLVEVSSAAQGTEAEPSYGTHFFQDLVEAGIYPLPITLSSRGAVLNTKFLEGAPNCLTELLPELDAFSPYVQVIDVPASAQGRLLHMVMNDELERAVGYLAMSQSGARR
ncbi:MAG: pyruvate, phosphate dikinase, partial [Anaerolineae bacterium]|nr:pyruvate, phosphate dikinase [Anaerolineae bacterium]